MGKETYRIEDYWHNEVTAFATAFGILGEREYPKEDFAESTDFNNLESSNPADTVKVATFLREKQYKPNENIKKDFYYVCEFIWQPYRKIKEYKNSEDITYEGDETKETSHLLFWIFWDEDFSCWQRSPAFACRYASSHHEAGDWMMKEITAAGSEAHDADYLKNGTLEILI